MMENYNTTLTIDRHTTLCYCKDKKIKINGKHIGWQNEYNIYNIGKQVFVAHKIEVMKKGK